ncbi:acyl-CoA dehydrogenase [Streptomyces sp. SID1121]|uniref:acyl-CoA dehydrogenase n=1 Tax=Streptomyces sp. SID1121 TaxID=3425888 RepID=UPI004057AA89
MNPPVTAPTSATAPGPVAGAAPFTVSEAALAELARITGTSCPPDVRERIVAALAGGPAPLPAEAGLPDDHAVHLRLRRLAESLPGVQEVFSDTELLAEVSACVAAADPSLYMAVLSHYILCAGSVLTLSGGDRPAPALARLEGARARGVFMVTEIGDASSHLAIRTTATFDPGRREFVLHTPDARAAKFSAVAVLGLPQTAVVCARVLSGGREAGVFSFAVELSDDNGVTVPGVHISDPLSAHALPLAYAVVRFDQVRVPYDNWLRDSAGLDADGVPHDPLGTPDARLRRTLSVGQALWATLPTAMAAMARGAAVTTLRHSTHRRSHGRLAPGAPVLTYRTQQHAVLGAVAEAFALSCTAGAARDTWSAAHRPPEGTGAVPGRGTGAAPGRATGAAPGQVRAGAKMTFAPWSAVDRPLAAYKAFTVRETARLAASCQHRSGLAGFLDVNRLQSWQGFAHAFDSAGGDSTLIMLDTGRALATDDVPPEPEPEPETGQGTPHHALSPADPAWWPAVTRALQRRLTADLRGALRARTEQGLEGLELWNPLLKQAQQLGEVYAHRLAAENLTAAVNGAEEPRVKQALPPLAALYGLLQAHRLSGVLQSTGVLDAPTVTALPALMDDRCDELAPYVPLLARGMALPEGLVPAPLGADEYAAALVEALDAGASGSVPYGGDPYGTGSYGTGMYGTDPYGIGPHPSHHTNTSPGGAT